jgi:hypothetical protein
VSVTKNFLAKSAVTVPATRPGDKIANTAQTSVSTLQTAKPRLVAKSGVSNVPRSLGKLNGAGSGPDASKVWNKNQPVPPPPPKQFTDEELKQQYGIHLATRLQADDGGKEAKWADIDDDEDDWTPEPVQWMDGTKSTVAVVENQSPPPEEPIPAPKVETPTILAKPTPAPTSTIPKTSLTGGTKTILKPGAHAQAITSKSKGQQDKPTLVAKPASAAPVKSPWAALPPMEKVSPIQINPPVQQPPSRFSRDNHGYDAMPPIPAKEIAPDDFNRSWRDERGNRELFNSNNGRYEPVGEMRRGSIRESSYRQQPAVLQRPAHDGPAEPSAAFQTSRTSGDGPTWGRRRNSSNVSGSSGRRMSFDRRVPDLPPMVMPTTTQRRESVTTNGVDAGAPGTPRLPLPMKPLPIDQVPDTLPQKTSPSVVHVQPVSPFGSAASQDAVIPGAQPQIQNLVEVQQRLLHGSLDLVKQRKLKEKEEWDKKEAEKKERLRKKLEALALSEDAKPKTKEELPKRLPEKSPQKEKATPAVAQSPPKPPVPTSEGEVAQYGMMKVHQPHPVRKPSPADAVTSKSVAAKPSPSLVKAQPETQARSQSQSKSSPSPAPLSAATTARLTRESVDTQPQAQQSSALVQHSTTPDAQGATPGQTTQAPWSSSLPCASWMPSVWGPPQAMNRALGNGTFAQQVVPQTKMDPPSAPIVSNSVLKPSSLQSAAPSDQAFVQQAMYPQAGTSPNQASVAPKPGPIAPLVEKGWGNFHSQIRRDDREYQAKARESYERLNGAEFRPEIRETYVDPQGKSHTTLHSRVIGIEAKISQPSAALDPKPKDEAVKASHEGPSLPQVIGQGAQIQPGTQGARPSRFFPRPSEAAPQASSTSSKDETPPPPETETHPAFSGDISHPVVKMPRPPPRVRLPPAAVEAAAQTEAPVSMPSRTRLGIGARPLALTQEWQARFNSLLEKPSAPAAAPAATAKPQLPTQAAAHAKTGALAVAASSKAPLEVRSNLAPATVSLPATATRTPFVNDRNREVITRVGAEFLLEDREFGSLPTVKLSKTPHLAANEPPAAFPSTRQNSRYRQPAMVVQSIDMFEVRVYRQTENDIIIFNIPVRLGNMRSTITRPLSKKRNGGRGSGHAKPKRTFNNINDSPTSGQNQRPRKSSNYQGQGSSTSTSARPSAGNAWSSNRSTSHNHPWSRRAAPAAPVH